MFTYIDKLKKMNYFPDTILDIGAHRGNWTDKMMKIYPNANYYLFEANKYNYNRFNNVDNIKIINEVLNDKIEEVDWYQNKGTGDSFFKEKTKHYLDTSATKKTTTTLDIVMEQNNFLKDSKNILIKIDCQGAEIPILKGSTKILSSVDFIIIEMPFFGQYNENVPNFLEHIQFMDTLGFIPFDIIEKHYINKFNMQIDMLFINKNHHFNDVVQKKLL
jgi:FkbM family methyltransferase